VWREFGEGLRFFARSRYLVALLTVAGIITMGAGALNGLDIFFVTDNLHADPHLYGFLAMAEGAGAIAGALCAGWVARRIGARRATWLPLLIGGLVVVLYARQTVFWSALLCIVAVAVPVAVLNVAIGPLVMDAAPADMLGRVMAVFNPIQMVMLIASTAVASRLASTVMVNFHADFAGVHMGRIGTIFTVSGLLIVRGGLYGALALPEGSSEPGPGPHAA
jgi:MFS family permease